jgi:hypothetical protein
VIIVCDRYSAYKKLARLVGIILRAFCWAHVRREVLDAGRALAELEAWALDWKAHSGELYHLNQQRLAQWRPELPLSEQNAAFGPAHQALQAALGNLHDEAVRALQDTVNEGKEGTNAAVVSLSKSAITSVTNRCQAHNSVISSTRLSARSRHSALALAPGHARYAIASSVGITNNAGDICIESSTMPVS